MDMIAMWPLALAAALGSAGLAGAWWYRKTRLHTQGAGHGARARGRRRPRRAVPAHGDALDTLAAWEPVVTRVLKTHERDAYQVLRRALPDHIILAQVPLARFIKVPTRNSYAEWLSRVGSLCADLVVCDMSSQVVAVVEVRQPAGGNKDNAAKRHARMDKVLQAARIPVHVWLEGALPGPTVAREAILGAAADAAHAAHPAGRAEAGLARRDAQAAAVVVAMQAAERSQPVQAVQPQQPARAVSAPGMDVRESALDFDIDVWMRSAQAEESHNASESGQREPPPSTWFDDLDTDPGTGMLPPADRASAAATTVSSGLRPAGSAGGRPADSGLDAPMFEDRPQARRA